MLSADGRWWWDGQAWQPALSPDGRYRWSGAAWLPASSSTMLVPTAWTERLRRATLALLALELVVGGIAVPVVFISTSNHLSVLVGGQGLTPSDQASLQQSLPALRQTIVTFGFVVLVLFLAWSFVLISGSVKRWRWVFWYQMIVGFIQAFSLLELPVSVPLYVQLQVPLALAGAAFVVEVLALALSIWMAVAVRRYGPWALQKVPQPARA